MASLPLANPMCFQIAPVAREPMFATIKPTKNDGKFSAMERSIIAFAERDGLSSIRVPGRLMSAIGRLFGFAAPNRLADDRLEALRRIAVFAWNEGWNVPKSEIAGFIAAGFTVDQYELIQHHVVDARRNRRRKTVR